MNALDTNMKLSINDLSRFFADVGASENCPICGKTDWTLASDDTEKNFDKKIEQGNIRMRIDFQSGPYLLDVLPISCSTCGFVRFHNANVIEKWANKLKGAQ
jgi:predicted nucleic-acid-binding Zn-ribbon protein